MARQNDEYKKLVKEYRKLAKKADQRLVRLEQLAGQKNFKNVLNWAYGTAQKQIRKWSGDQATRFNVKPPAKTQSLRAKIRDIQSFLSKVSSTKSGIIKTYKKRAESLNKNNGTNFTWEQMGSFFESDEWEDLDNKYGSGTAVKAVGILQQHEDDKRLLESIEEKGRSNLKLDNKKTQKAVDDLISEYGLKVFDLYK